MTTLNLTLQTGKQECTCPTCQNKMTATVAGRVKKNANRQQYKEYRGFCRKCKTIYTGILKLRNW